MPRQPRAGVAASQRLEVWVTPAEAEEVRAFARLNGYTVADCLRLGVAALAQEAGGDPDDPPLRIDRWVRDELRLLRIRRVLAGHVPLTPEQRLEAIRDVVAGK